MEAPARTDSESVRDEKVKVLKAIEPLDRRRTLSAASSVVTETRQAWHRSPRLKPSPRCDWALIPGAWKGVPFYIRAGKCMSVTCTEVIVRLRQPPVVFSTCCSGPNYFRYGISPELSIAVVRQSWILRTGWLAALRNC